MPITKKSSAQARLSSDFPFQSVSSFLKTLGNGAKVKTQTGRHLIILQLTLFLDTSWYPSQKLPNSAPVVGHLEP